MTCTKAIGAETERGHNMITHSGEPFWPVSPETEDICIQDIAHALSLQCRFNGHTREFYSVAQHSFIVASLLPVELQLEGLLHDAAEAYIGDLIKPLKPHCPDFCAIDHRLDQKIREKFNLPAEMSPEVKEADLKVVVTEKRDLLNPHPKVDWGAGLPEPLPDKIIPLPPREAKALFLYGHSLSRRGISVS